MKASANIARINPNSTPADTLPGDISYDAVKAVIKRLYAQRSKLDSWEMAPLGTHTSIEVFVRHTREYVNGMLEVDVTVRQYIEEEERADLISKTRSDLVSRLSNANDPEKVNAAVKEAVRAALQKIKAGENFMY